MTPLQFILDMIMSVTPAGIAFLIGMLIIPFIMRAMPTILSIICVGVLTWLYLHDTSISTAVLMIGLCEFLVIKLFLRARAGKAPRWSRRISADDTDPFSKGKRN